AGGGAAGRRRRLLWLRVGQTTRAAQRQLPVADVLERDAVHGTGGGTGALPRGVGLSLPRPETEAGAATAAALDLRPGQEEEGRRVAVDQRAGPSAVVGGQRRDLLSPALGKRGPIPGLQADAGQGETGEPDGAAGTPRGGEFVVGVATDAGPRGASGIAAACPEGCGAGLQSAQGAAGDPPGDVRPVTAGPCEVL